MLDVPKHDRLARFVPDARAIADQLATKGAKLALAASIDNPTDPMGKMFFNILASFAAVRDRDYPVSTLRKAGLLKKNLISELV